MKKYLLCLLVVLLALSLTGCFGKKAEENLIGVAMPTQSLQRWNQDGANMKAKLEEKGYKVDLQYANNDVNTQIQQLENMITKKCKVLVIASIDGSALT
ncbi:MAG TPA: substrate-binding domain-containing protein, partial [Capillibacterium sp.]